MRYIDNAVPFPVIELTRRNLEVLLAKLDDPLSQRMIYNDNIAVRAVENDAYYTVRAVENDAHYSNRPAGEMYMPSTGEII